jgi:hypothetical protein
MSRSCCLGLFRWRWINQNKKAPPSRPAAIVVQNISIYLFLKKSASRDAVVFSPVQTLWAKIMSGRMTEGMGRTE